MSPTIPESLGAIIYRLETIESALYLVPGLKLTDCHCTIDRDGLITVSLTSLKPEIDHLTITTKLGSVDFVVELVIHLPDPISSQLVDKLRQLGWSAQWVSSYDSSLLSGFVQTSHGLYVVVLLERLMQQFQHTVRVITQVQQLLSQINAISTSQ